LAPGSPALTSPANGLVVDRPTSLSRNNCVSWSITPIHSADTLNQPCPEGRVDGLIESAKAHFRAKVEHPFRVIKQQFGFQKT
jgi:hypothetical protein